MRTIRDVTGSARSLEPFEALIGVEGLAVLQDAFSALRAAGSGRVFQVNSTAHGGGVAEMLSSIVAYQRGGGLDARWLVVPGTPEFFTITKRVHNRLHGSLGDGGPLGPHERAEYDRVLAPAAVELGEVIEPGDAVILHDPQTAGLIRPLAGRTSALAWRCHVGVDAPDDVVRSAWAFLLPDVQVATASVFSRRAFVWEGLEGHRVEIEPPVIDAFSPKNADLSEDATWAVLAAAGLITGGAAGVRPAFVRGDGSTDLVRRTAEVDGGPLPVGAPWVTQVSRWDRLKDPVGVIEGFAAGAARVADAHLVLAGPSTGSVDDDPEGAGAYADVVAARDHLERAVRGRVHLARLPMEDAEENAAIVNALQRRSGVVVQKSLAEGFGLTVAEAMWKARPVVASKVGGIQDQIEDGRSGVLVDPVDLEGFGAAVARLVFDRARAEAMGVAAKERVRERFLVPRALTQEAALLADLLRS